MKMKCEPGELRLPEDAPKPPKKKQTPTGGTRTSRPGNTEREAAPSWTSAGWQATKA